VGGAIPASVAYKRRHLDNDDPETIWGRLRIGKYQQLAKERGCTRVIISRRWLEGGGAYGCPCYYATREHDAGLVYRVTSSDEKSMEGNV